MCSAHSPKLLDHLLVVAFKLSKSLQTIFMPTLYNCLQNRITSILLYFFAQAHNTVSFGRFFA